MRYVVDIETTSLCDLGTCGAWVYAEHPSTRLLCIAWCDADSDAAPQSWDVMTGSGEELERVYAKLLCADTLIAHNANFDSKFLKQSMKKVGIAFDNVRVWDSLTLSRIAYQDVPNHRLDTLVQELGIERSRAHRALPDADACGKLFVMAYEKIGKLDPWLLAAFGRIAEGSDWEPLFEKKGELPVTKFALPDVPPASSLPAGKAPRVSEFFKEGGLLSGAIDGFKVRTGQQEYASCVERNMHKGGLCVLEAPTGSGKSLAYLVSAANKAVTGERVVISTATHALQSQLWDRDIPAIMPLYNGALKPAILKGRDNYLCLRKLSEILEAPASLLAPDERDSFMAILPWAVSTQSGEVGECSSFSHSRNRVLWSKLSSNASSCAGEKCPFYSKCPALGAKRRAMAANLLLVNHSLFLADLSLDFALLPSYEHVVFDEAHKLPDISNQSFVRTISFFGFRNVAKTLVSPKEGVGGLLSEISARIPEADEAARSECEQLIADIAETEKNLQTASFLNTRPTRNRLLSSSRLRRAVRNPCSVSFPVHRAWKGSSRMRSAAWKN